MDTSRTEPVEGSASPQRTRRALYDQDIHNPRAETARLPRDEPQRHGARH